MKDHKRQFAKRRGVELRIVLASDATPNWIDLPLLKAVARAHRLADDLVAGRVPSARALAKREGGSSSLTGKVLRLGFLLPTIVEAIAADLQPPHLTFTSLMRWRDLSRLPSAQEHALAVL